MKQEQPTALYGAKAYLKGVFARLRPHRFAGATVREFSHNSRKPESVSQEDRRKAQ